ncbi:MAG: hypothetical protein IJP54_05460 [Synergistaceae bacterium]|nr:hypothetical protein [Synergistaceae bacterium]MBR0035101.1 hypothetical protein [Synergistaceae bacterium]
MRTKHTVSSVPCGEFHYNTTKCSAINEHKIMYPYVSGAAHARLKCEASGASNKR